MSRDCDQLEFGPADGIQNDYEKFVSLMIEGKYLFGSNAPDHVYDSPEEEEIVKQTIVSANTYLERIEIIHKYFNTKRFLEELRSYEEILTKNEVMMGKLKNRADWFWRESEFTTAVRCLNLALAYAPNPDKLIHDICKERENTLISSDGLRVPVRDIKPAGHYPCTSENFSARIESRESIDDFVPDIQKIEAEDEADGLSSAEEKLDYLDDAVFKVHGKHNKILKSASNRAVLKSEKDKGLGLFAKKNITTGSTLIVEKPYVGVLDEILIWDMAHCSKCFKKIMAIFPCNSCVFATYCSEKCRIGDFDAGHRYECRCMAFLHTVRADQFVQLSLKAICRAGPRVLFDFFKNGEPEPGKDGVEDIEGMNTRTGVYASNDYYAINHLESDICEKDMPYYTWLSISIAAILDHETDFIRSLKICEDERKAFVIFLASKTLQHCLTLPCNAVRVSEHETSMGGGDAEYVMKKPGEKQIITAIYPLISILNHISEPNVIWASKTNGEIAVLASRELHQGEQLKANLHV